MEGALAWQRSLSLNHVRNAETLKTFFLAKEGLKNGELS